MLALGYTLFNLEEPMAKTTKLTVWELALIEEALRSYAAPGFGEDAKRQQQLLISKITGARSGLLLT